VDRPGNTRWETRSRPCGIRHHGAIAAFGHGKLGAGGVGRGRWITISPDASTQHVWWLGAPWDTLASSPDGKFLGNSAIAADRRAAGHDSGQSKQDLLLGVSSAALARTQRNLHLRRLSKPPLFIVVRHQDRRVKRGGAYGKAISEIPTIRSPPTIKGPARGGFQITSALVAYFQPTGLLYGLR